MKHFSDHETSTIKSNDFVSVGGSHSELTKKRCGACEDFEPQGVVGEPAKKLVESAQLGVVGASKFSTRNYGTPKQGVYHSLSSGKLVCADGGEGNITHGTKSIEKVGNTSVREKQLKSRSKASTNVDSVGISSKSKPDEKSVSSGYCGASRPQSQYTTDRAKTTPLTSVGPHKPNKSTAKVEAWKGHHRSVEQSRDSKPASSVSGRHDKSKQH